MTVFALMIMLCVVLCCFFLFRKIKECTGGEKTQVDKADAPKNTPSSQSVVRSPVPYVYIGIHQAIHHQGVCLPAPLAEAYPSSGVYTIRCDHIILDEQHVSMAICDVECSNDPLNEISKNESFWCYHSRIILPSTLFHRWPCSSVGPCASHRMDRE